MNISLDEHDGLVMKSGGLLLLLTEMAGVRQ